MKRGNLAVMASLVVCCLLLLAGCGGGGSKGGGTVTVGAAKLTGTAAAGAPIIGFVTVKDATGVMKTVPIEGDGKYTVDVTGLQAPFKIRAQGKVGSSSIVCYSAALSSDIGGTINVTPFTNLIIAQVAGELADTYFQRTDTSSLTPARLAAETARVRNVLSNVLQSVGVSTSIDLLRASFTTNGAGLDKVMDIIKVAVNPLSGAAEITNVINGSSVSYPVASPGTPTAIAAPTASALSDVDQIRQGTAKFFDLFATSIPSLQQVQALGLIEEGSFKHGGFNFNAFYSENLMDPYIIGIKFLGLKLLKLTETSADAEIAFSLQGMNINFVWKFTKINGVWKALGDQRIADISIGAAGGKDSWSNATQYSTGVNIDIETPLDSVAYALVKGAGLPTGGVRLNRSMYSSQFVVVTTGGGGDYFPMDDATIATAFTADAANIPYTFELYASDGSLLASYTETLSKPPCTRAELQSNSARYFATINPSTPAALASLLAPLRDGNTHLTSVAWTIPKDLLTSEVTVELWGNNTGNRYNRQAPTGTSLTFAMQAMDSTGQRFSIGSAEYRVHLRDAFGREFDTAVSTTIP